MKPKKNKGKHRKHSKTKKITITKKRLKRNFTEEEDLEILKFLVKNKKFSETNDNKLWALMENYNVISRRSAQSMRERFNKKISPNLTLKLLCAIYTELL